MSEIDGPGMMNMASKGSFGANMAGAAFGAAGGAGYMMSTMNGGGHLYNQMEMTSMDQGMSGGHLGMMRDEYSTYDSGMALNEDFLNHYYSNVSGDILESKHTKKERLEFDITQSMGTNPRAAGAQHYINLPAFSSF